MGFVAEIARRIFYRIAGLPVAVATAFASSNSIESDPVRSAFARRYWHPETVGDGITLVIGILLTPIAFVSASLLFTSRNGPMIRRRYGKSIAAQFAEQLKLYLSASVLPPWYYIFELHDDGAARAPTFINRFETKRCLFPLLKPRDGSPLQDKSRFAEYCRKHGLRCVQTLMHLHGKDPGLELPDEDVFVKPSKGKGGRGAERWDCIAPSVFAGSSGEQLSSQDLRTRLITVSRRNPLIVQPRLSPHLELAQITAGALPTLRILSCLNRQGAPDVVAAMLRTSIGNNRTIDNLHAGGLGALVDLKSGILSRSSNLGADARLGWMSTHPDTGAQIEGRRVPFWAEAKALAIAAHHHFDDRVVIGWDIAVLEDGPILVEGNGNPDLDILQRFMRIGLREQRFGELLAFYLEQRGACQVFGSKVSGRFELDRNVPLRKLPR